MAGILPLSIAGGYRSHAPGLLVGAQSGELFRGNANCVTRAAARESLDQIGQGQDADASQSELCRYFLHRRLRSLAALLAIERQSDAGRLRTRGADDLDRFANRRARRNHVVDDDDATLERTADDVAAFTVILRLLAIEGPGHVAMMM